MISVHYLDDNNVLDSSQGRADDGSMSTAPPPLTATEPIGPTAAPSDAVGGGRAAWTAAAAMVPAVWGTTYVVTTHLLPEGHPLFAAMMRSLPAGLIALLLARQLPTGSWWWRSVVLGALNMAAFFPLLFVAAQRLPGGVAATLGAVQPILVAFLAVGILRERLSSWRASDTPSSWCRSMAADGLVGVRGGMWASRSKTPHDSQPARSLCNLPGIAAHALRINRAPPQGRGLQLVVKTEVRACCSSAPSYGF